MNKTFALLATVAVLVAAFALALPVQASPEVLPPAQAEEHWSGCPDGIYDYDYFSGLVPVCVAGDSVSVFTPSSYTNYPAGTQTLDLSAACGRERVSVGIDTHVNGFINHVYAAGCFVGLLGTDGQVYRVEQGFAVRSTQSVYIAPTAAQLLAHIGGQ